MSVLLAICLLMVGAFCGVLIGALLGVAAREAERDREKRKWWNDDQR